MSELYNLIGAISLMALPFLGMWIYERLTF